MKGIMSAVTLLKKEYPRQFPSVTALYKAAAIVNGLLSGCTAACSRDCSDKTIQYSPEGSFA